MKKDDSFMSSEHIVVRTAPGRTEGFLAALRGYLALLLSLGEEAGSVSIGAVLDGREIQYENLGSGSGAAAELSEALGQAQSIDLRIDLCCTDHHVSRVQAELMDSLRDGALRDCVRYCALYHDDQTASLMQSGFYRGAFMHDSVPFVVNNEDILVTTGWNGLNHRAEFKLRDVTEAAALVERLRERFEVELTLDEAERMLVIDGVELKNRRDVLFYREALERLCELSEHSQILGSLMPDSDRVFALLRFVQEGSRVVILTAVAEE